MPKNYPIPFSKGEDLIYISLGVSDYERAKKFYQDIFNFEITLDTGIEVGWCELELPIKGIKLGLNLNKNKEIINGSTVLGFSVGDIDATKQYFDSKSVETTEIRDLPDLISIFDIKDSEGNIIQFVGEPRLKTEK